MPEHDSVTRDLRRSPGDRRMKAILVLVATLAFVASPYFSAGFSGFDPEAFPIPQISPPIQPAGYAFAIWGLIYLWLILHAGFGLLRRADDPAWDAGRWPLFVSLGVGSGWIAVANTDPVWATMLIWVMLLGALAALFLTPARPPARDRWLAQAPLAIYAGWLSAASWVSVGLLLAGYGLTGERAAALVVLPLAVGFTLVIQARLPRAPEYGLTVIWALAAIAQANLGTDLLLAALASLGALAIAALLMRSLRPASGA
ncbi:hypothetical protein [Alkalilacustris brevis]|uniref:hypothetical protein n=1 Tax=Alkalilacustris brevis TaxID=2026338 RepID=UPI001EE48E5D|nr:hypothetical protein [Alkalilacustris brevis]